MTPAFHDQMLRRSPFGRYRLTIGPALSWRIDDGVSRFLIAEGSGYSLPLGRRLLQELRTSVLRPGRKVRR